MKVRFSRINVSTLPAVGFAILVWVLGASHQRASFYDAGYDAPGLVPALLLVASILVPIGLAIGATQARGSRRPIIVASIALGAWLYLLIPLVHLLGVRAIEDVAGHSADAFRIGVAGGALLFCLLLLLQILNDRLFAARH